MNHRPRPWIRFWARMLDYAFYSIVFGFITEMLGIPIIRLHPIIVGICIFFTWCFIEAIFLSTWGFTPGKWLLRTEIRDKDGEKLSYRNALSRSLTVWWLGLAAGIPIVLWITMIVAAVKISKKGKTTWDEMYETQVIHGPIGFWRTFFTVIIFFFLFLMLLSAAKQLQG